MNTEEAAKFVLREIKKYRVYDDIALDVAQKFDMTWDEAYEFVRQMEFENFDQLNARHRRFSLLIGLTFAIAGAGTSITTALLYFSGAGINLVLFNIVELPYFGNLILFFVGAAMAVGGIVGMSRLVRDV